MLEVIMESGERLWISVYAIRSIAHAGPPGITVVTWTDGSTSRLRQHAADLVRQVRQELDTINNGPR